MTDIARLGMQVDSRPVAAASGDLKAFSKASEGAGKAATNLGAASKRSFGVVAAGVTAALSAVVSLGSATRIIADFESSMSRLGAVSRASTDELAAMRDVAKELGATTEFSATQAADGLNFLAMAGFSASEAMDSIPAVLDLATASGLGLAQAADTASNIMSGFGIEAGNAASVADVLAAASSRANTNVSQLGSAMSTVAPISAALDISLADTAAAIGILSDAGIQGERAGTAMRGVLASLAGPTEQATNILHQMGLTINDINPETNDLSVVLGRLGAAGISTSQAMALFGREAASGALVLVDGAQRLGEFGDELTRVDGEAQAMAATMRDNLGGDLKSAVSAAQGLALAIGDAGLTSALRVAVQGATAFVRGISAAVEWVGDFRGYVIAAALGLTAYYAPAMAGAIASTYAWASALVTLRGALAATGVGALLIGAGLAINKMFELIEATGGVGSALALMGDIASEVWDRAGFALRAFSFRFTGAMQGISASAVETWDGIVANVYGAAATMVDVATGVKDAFIAAFSALPDALGSLMYSAANAVVGGVEALINGVIRRVNTFTAAVSNPLNNLPDWAKPDGGFSFGGGLDEVSFGGVSNPLAGSQGVASSAQDAFTAAQGQTTFNAPDNSGLISDLQAGAAVNTGLADVFGEATNAPLQSLEALQAATEGATSALDEGTMSAEDYVAALGAVEGASTGAGEGSGGGAAGAVGAVGSAAKDTADELEKGGFWGDFESGIKSGITQVRNFSDAWDLVKNSAASALQSIGSNLISAGLGSFGLGGGTASGLFGAASNLFAGFFDGGGNIPAGMFGVTAEKRDEFVNGTLVRGPATVTGGAQTERILNQGNNNGTIVLDLRTDSSVITDIAGNTTGMAIAQNNRAVDEQFNARSSKYLGSRRRRGA